MPFDKDIPPFLSQTIYSFHAWAFCFHLSHYSVKHITVYRHLNHPNGQHAGHGNPSNLIKFPSPKLTSRWH